MAIPPGNHTDFPRGLRWIPRWLTAHSSNTLPKVLLSKGLDGHNPDVPPPGGRSLSISKFGINLAITTKSGWHFRIGTFRYDYVDHYYEFPTFTFKKMKI